MQATSLVLGGIAPASLAAGALAQEPRLVAEDMMMPSDPGIEVFVRGRCECIFWTSTAAQ
jgi:hypothetical protein